MVWSAGRGEGGWWWVSRLILSTYSPHEPRAFFFLAPADIYLILPTFFVLFSPTCASNALQHWVGLHFSQHSSCPDYAWLRHFSPHWGTKQQPKSYSAPLPCHPPSPSKKIHHPLAKRACRRSGSIILCLLHQRWGQGHHE